MLHKSKLWKKEINISRWKSLTSLNRVYDMISYTEWKKFEAQFEKNPLKTCRSVIMSGFYCFLAILLQPAPLQSFGISYLDNDFFYDICFP